MPGLESIQGGISDRTVRQYEKVHGSFIDAFRELSPDVQKEIAPLVEEGKKHAKPMGAILAEIRQICEARLRKERTPSNVRTAYSTGMSSVEKNRALERFMYVVDEEIRGRDDQHSTSRETVH